MWTFSSTSSQSAFTIEPTKSFSPNRNKESNRSLLLGSNICTTDKSTCFIKLNWTDPISQMRKVSYISSLHSWIDTSTSHSKSWWIKIKSFSSQTISTSYRRIKSNHKWISTSSISLCTHFITLELMIKMEK